ncbi:hypothetical protein TNCV_4122891 [Trichonephila clavipes]|nr:hypothetical protein TNCV_4122891 [Trichonephila clavipes]
MLVPHIRDKSRKETSSSKISANGPDKISMYDSDVKGPSKYIGPIKCLASRTGIHPTTKLYSGNLDFRPMCLTRNWKNQNDAPGLRALVSAPGLDGSTSSRCSNVEVKRKRCKQRCRLRQLTVQNYKVHCRPCCCLQAEEFLGVPLTPPKKGDAFPTPGRRQCTHKYIMVWDVFWEFPAFWVSYGPREDIPPLTSDQSEKLIVFRERVLSRIHRPCCCLQAEEFLGVPLTPPKKGDAFPTPGRRQCTHKYIMVWDVFWEFPAFWVSYGPREDIPPLTSDQSEKLIVFRERVLSRIHR